MKTTRMNSLFINKRFLPLQFTILTLAQLMLSSCGGGGNGDAVSNDGSSSVTVSSSASVISSSSVSSSISNTPSSVSSEQTSKSSSQSSNDLALIDASHQFTSTTNENFYVFNSPSEPHVLRYFPKQLALTGSPGIASVQHTNKISTLLKAFLDLSESDWSSADQITFSSRFTLDVDLQRLRQESEAAGYTELADFKVKPPQMFLEQRHTTSVPPDRIKIECENLTLLINGNDVTLHDCNLADTDGITASQTINNIGSFRYEKLNFDPEAISGNRSLRGTFNVDYTLPGTRKFDQILSTNSGDLQTTWQLYLNWPTIQTTVNSATTTINWKMLLADFNAHVLTGETLWNENTISTFVSSAINGGAIVLAPNTDFTSALHSSINSYLKQELFVAIYSEGSDSPLMWAPKIRFKNVDQLNTQQLVFRYFDSELLIRSKIDLSCLTQPDAQNNIDRSSTCSSNPIP
jgi:hypothetical protein